MIVSGAAMRALEEAAFASGTSAEDLMEEAGAAIAREVQRIWPLPGVCFAVFGKGNNGGDALVAARHLAAAGWGVTLVAASPVDEWGELARKKHAQAQGCTEGDLSALVNARATHLVVLDGLLGIGARAPLQPTIAEHTRAINQLRASGNAAVFALDLPTGLDADTGKADPDCVIADVTLSIGFAKKGLVADDAADVVGRLRVLRLAALTKQATGQNGNDVVLDAVQLRGVLPRRRFDTHKGNYGRVGIIAGSPGMLGAAALCAQACVRAGAGLITLYATADIADRLSLITVPEVMVRPVPGIAEIPFETQDGLAIGPGLSLRDAEDVLSMIERAKQPMVVDADALNALARRPESLKRIAGPRVLTPHPGEMARLAPHLHEHGRAELARRFVEGHPNTTLLLKGARTIVTSSPQKLAFNSTGTPGMATGGMGDILTGVILAFLGQGIEPTRAAELGAWICGRAAEFAVDVGGESDETLIPTILLNFLGHAFREVRASED